VPVEAGKSAELTVESIHPLKDHFELTDLDPEKVGLLVQQNRMTPALKKSFDRILAQKMKIDGISNQIVERKRESDHITLDQSRIRENMKALKGSSEEKALIQRYVGQFDSQESRLAILRKEVADLTAQETSEKQELDRIVMQASADESF
jgi:uncharacterized protein with NAD-binding domain and iron-sulfur cluster